MGGMHVKMHLRWTSVAMLALVAMALMLAAGCQQGSEEGTAAVTDGGAGVALAAQPEEAAAEESDDPMDMLGKEAPSFVSETLDGDEMKLEDYLGKQVVLLTLWTPNCPVCQEAVPEIVDIAEENKDEEAENKDEEEPEGVADFKLLTVYLGGDADAPKDYLEDKGYDFPVALDPEGEIKDKYRLSMTPHTVLVGADGTVQAVYPGWDADSKDMVSDHVTRVRAGEDITDEAMDAPMGGG
jgi:peroxiredoxin